jgi:hypothetical protein
MMAKIKEEIQNDPPVDQGFKAAMMAINGFPPQQVAGPSPSPLNPYVPQPPYGAQPNPYGN